MNRFYNFNTLTRYLIWLAVLVLSCKFTKGGAFVALLPVAYSLLAQRKNEVFFYVLMITTFSMEMNSYFMPKSFTMVVSQKLLLMSVAGILLLQVFGRRHSSLLTPVLSLLPYLLFMTGTAHAGWSPAISYLKLLLFVMVFFALYGCAVRTMNDRCDGGKIRTMILAMSCFMIFGSLLLLPFPGISYMGADELLRNPGTVSLFKGMSWHSQTLGPMLAMLATVLFADWVFSIQRRDWLYFGLIACALLLIFKTSSRTAMGSFLGGVGFVSFFALKDRGVISKVRAKIVTYALFSVLLGGVLVLTVPRLNTAVRTFILKYDKGAGPKTLDKDVILGSRRHKLDSALYNFHRSPVIGNGFQVSEEMAYVKINGLRDMLSAPVEKSTWTYAILEEGGVIGMILFVLFILVSLGLMIRRRAFVGAASLFTFLVVNMGEFGFFSMSASGGTSWTMIFAGLTLDHVRLQNLRFGHGGYRPRNFRG